MSAKSPKRDAITDLFKSFAGQAGNLVIPRPYIEFCNGDHLAALLLSQILYWSDRTEDPDGWFAKSYDEWHKELAMTQYQVNRALYGDKRTKKNNGGLSVFGVETKVARSTYHKGAATLHYRVNTQKLQQAILNYLGIPVINNVDNRDMNNVDNDVVDNVKNESTDNVDNVNKDYTENTTEGETTALEPPADNLRRDVQSVPTHYRDMMALNMNTHPLWEAYCEAMGFQKNPVFSKNDKRLAFDLDQKGFTPDEVRAVVRRKLREKKGDYPFQFLANDLAQHTRTDRVAIAKVLATPTDDVPLPDPGDFYNIAGVGQ